MRPLFQVARLVLPVLLFGYGIVANLAVLTGPPTSLTLPKADLLAGGLTHDFERQYKTTLPHFSPSFGVIGAVRYAVLDEARSGAVVGRDGWLFTSEEVRALPDTVALQTAIQQIKDVQGRLADQGTQLVLLPLPAKIDVYSANSPNPALSAAMAQLNASFLTSLHAAGIAAIDPRPALMGQDKPVFFATDTHWTPFGAAQVAQTVAASLPHGPLSYTTSSVTIKPLTGDLIRYVTEDSLAPLIGLFPEDVQLTSITATAAPADIFGAAAVDIVLIGTSYSANPDWGFANALTRNLGRDVVNLAAVGLGPVSPMTTYLKSDEFKATPAKLVIWEFPVRYLTDPALWDIQSPATKPLAGGSEGEVASNG
jgi:alginate O-acetyltransferase complex protein AlgJ